ncbi:hypothetical protein UPYG_G00009630 [Umbra pygmaea]|uniref:Protein FAM217B n=1 Tax=Umbra pygmaea TaxID=75934 RepID=A0ABD0XI88_UMBPY
MGPIMQERTGSTSLKRIVSKEKIRTKNSENNGPATSSKKASKVKKAGVQLRYALPGLGQDKGPVSTIQSGLHSKGSRVKSGTIRNTSKLPSPQEEGGLKCKSHPQSSTQRQEEKQDVKRTSPCCGELDQNRGALSQSRRALSLPLSPILGPRQGSMRPHTHSHCPTLESLRRFEQKEDETDSASDLSDSERQPVLPSPCTPCSPPHLNLRAEVINSNDFPPAFPGPHGTTSDIVSYSYPDFLPPPFNAWSLRQLAVFLHTEGRGAPRPKPVGPLEKYLERLLQLEWLQIQTVQEETCRAAGVRPRSLGIPPAPSAVNSPRPHTAPSSHLSSPKDLRQCQRTFPYGPHNNPTSPAAQQAARLPVCPHCHIRYPLCNGSCSSYAYQRHSRLSPLLERRARAGVPPKRSSSESRVPSSEGRVMGGGQTPRSPSAGRSHLRQMQAVGNVRKSTQEPGINSKVRAGVKKGRARANGEAEGSKESFTAIKADVGVEKRIRSGSNREVNTSKRAEKDWQRAETRGQVSYSGVKRTVKEPPSVSKPPLSAKTNGKSKNVHFVAK